MGQHRVDRPTLTLIRRRGGGRWVPVHRQEVCREIQGLGLTLPLHRVPESRIPRPRAAVRRCNHTVMSTKAPVVVQIQERQIDFLAILRLQRIRQRGARRGTVRHPTRVRTGCCSKLGVDRRHVQVTVRITTGG